MAITTAERTQIIELTVLMFNAAPGATYLAQIVALYEANPGTAEQKLQALANQLSQTSAFTSLHPNFETAEEFAAEFLTPLGLQNDAVARDFVIAKFNAGVSKGQIMYEGYVALNAVPDTGAAQYVAANAILNNKTTVAEYYSVTKGGAATDLTSLQATVNNVTADASSVTAAKAAIDGTAAGGVTFNLTPGADNIVGTAGDDVVNALTVNTSGAAATTLSSFDAIDGASGTDTLNIYSDNTANLNDTLPATLSVKNVEVVNILNANAAAGVFGDASLFGTSLQQLWQVNFADNVTKLATGQTAGFRSVDANVSVTPTTAAAAAMIALDNYGESRTITVDGSAATATLASVTVSGTVKDTNADGTVATTNLAVNTGKDVESMTLNTAVRTTLTVTDNAASGATKEVRTVDASASSGGITFAGTVGGGTAGALATIRTGSGRDTVTITTATLKDDAATAAVDETVSAVLNSGAGNDTLTINTTGTGTTSVDAGDGNDTVTLTADGSGKLTVSLGAGNDKFNGAGSVAATDVVDGGEGSDTLLLNMLGSANIGAFSNFEVFDAAGLAGTLDVDILATKNTVAEFVASADVGAGATLTNVGAGVGYRVTGDTTIANALTLTQKTAGALTVTLDIDETGTTAATTVAANADASVVATNATSIKAVFDSAFVGAATGATDNATLLSIAGDKATTVEVVSGGANASNQLSYTTQSASGKSILTSVTATGDRALNLDLTIAGGGTNEVATVNASGLSGALTFSLADLKASTGALTVGTGADVLTAQAGSATAAAAVTDLRAVSSFQKGSVEDAAAQGSFDVITVTGAVQAADNTVGTADASVKDGKITFKGTGPATLTEAVTMAQTLIGANEAVVFEYIGNSYVFAEGATDGAGTDVLVQLAGLTGLAGLDNITATANLYVF